MYGMGKICTNDDGKICVDANGKVVIRCGDVYASVVSGRVWKQTNGRGPFEVLSHVSIRDWHGLGAKGETTYGLDYEGFAYQNFVTQFTDFTAYWADVCSYGKRVLFFTKSGGNDRGLYKYDGNGWFRLYARGFNGLTVRGNTLYVTDSTDIYKFSNIDKDGWPDGIVLEPGQEATPEILEVEPPYPYGWSGMTTHKGNVYVACYGGGIYMQTGGDGGFNVVDASARYWRHMTTLNNNVYAAAEAEISGGLSGLIFMQTGGLGNFVAVEGDRRAFWGMTATPVYPVHIIGEDYAVGEEVIGTNDFKKYICRVNHTATADNRPNTGENWELYWRLKTFGCNL